MKKFSPQKKFLPETSKKRTEVYYDRTGVLGV